MGAKEVWIFLAGTALFIYAMGLVEDSLKNIAGRSFKKILHKLTSTKFKSLLGGASVTAVLQSSSIVLLMTLSFVGAGIISMRNALAITLGSNLGTTLSSWIVASLGFKTSFGNFSYILLSITILGLFFKRNKKVKSIFQFLAGFALLFVGLDMMKESAGTLIAHFDLQKVSGISPYLFIPIGVIVTFLIQSSSATMAITLTALFSHAISFESAVAIVIGAELGTTLKLLIGAIGGNADKKRVALGNFLYNLVMIILAAIFLQLISLLIKDICRIQDDLIALVFFQSLINIAGILIFYPTLGLFSRLLEKIYKDKNNEVNLVFIKPVKQSFADDSIIMARKELLRLLNHTLIFNQMVINAGKKADSSFKTYIKSVFEPFQIEVIYNQLKQLQGEIIQYLAELPTQEMNKEEMEKSGILITVSRNIIHSAKNIKDINHNLEELESTTNEELNKLYKKLVEEETSVYLDIHEMINTGLSKSMIAPIEGLQDQNILSHKGNIEHTLLLIKNQKISDMDASTLLNVYREIYSSRKAILEVLLDLMEE